MGSIEVLAVSPGLPVDDLLAHPEGGPLAAAQALTALLPDAVHEHVGTATWAMPGLSPPDAVLVSTFGETTMFLASPAHRLTVPEGLSTFSLSYQSVSMAYGVDVSGPRFQRTIALSPGMLDYAEGAPLPFEAPFSAGLAEADATYTFDDHGFVSAAGEWMFGCQPLEVPWSELPRTEDRFQLGSAPLHVFTAAATPALPEASDSRPRRGALSRLFRRG